MNSTAYSVVSQRISLTRIYYVVPSIPIHTTAVARVAWSTVGKTMKNSLSCGREGSVVLVPRFWCSRGSFVNGSPNPVTLKHM
jgi:hypothetical protein